MIQEACEVAGKPSLIADLGVQGVWQPQAEALFYLLVIDTDALSHVQRSAAAVLSSAEAEKMKKYNNAAIARQASFTPFLVYIWYHLCILYGTASWRLQGLWAGQRRWASTSS